MPVPNPDSDFWSPSTPEAESDSDSTLYDPDIKHMMRPSLARITSFHHARVPSLTAPWPEPPSPTHTSTFEFFPLLPLSIRLQVWTHALPGPRIIQIQYRNYRHEFHSPTPVLLHISREARSLALHHYELISSSTPGDYFSSFLRIFSPRKRRQICYVNFRIDTFCPSISFRSFVTGELKRFLRTLPDCDKIERFGLPKRCFLFPSPACVPLLLRFGALREVVVLGDPCLVHLRQDGFGEMKRERWELVEGEVLPTLAEWEAGRARREGQIFERYVVEFMDKVREVWREESEWELRFVFKRVCWGGRCWEDGWEGRSVQDKSEHGERGRNEAVKKIWGYSRRGVARLMMLVLGVLL